MLIIFHSRMLQRSHGNHYHYRKTLHLRKSASMLDLEGIYYKHPITGKIRNLKIFQAIRRRYYSYVWIAFSNWNKSSNNSDKENCQTISIVSFTLPTQMIFLKNWIQHLNWHHKGQILQDLFWLILGRKKKKAKGSSKEYDRMTWQRSWIRRMTYFGLNLRVGEA